MTEKVTWWQRRGWITVIGSTVLLAGIFAAVGVQSDTSASSPSTNTEEAQTVAATPIAPAQPVTPTYTTSSRAKVNDGSGVQEPPRDSNGLIHQLKINASLKYRSIAFTSGENYTNCTDELTVITMDGSQQPVFTTYKDNYGIINLFTGDEHSIAYGSLTDNSGNTLASDIISGKYRNNAAGNWGLTCDQGEYSLRVNTIN